MFCGNFFSPSVSRSHWCLPTAIAAADAQTRHAIRALEATVDEKDSALAQLGREMEALRDAQSEMGIDFAVAQRQVGRTEEERRAAIVAEQRGVWAALGEVERSVRYVSAQRAVQHLMQAEAVARHDIAEEQARSVEVARAVEELRELVTTGRRSTAETAAALLELERSEVDARMALSEDQFAAATGLAVLHTNTRRAARHKSQLLSSSLSMLWSYVSDIECSSNIF